jgi:uncharacterized protein (DUF58 family)
MPPDTQKTTELLPPDLMQRLEQLTLTARRVRGGQSRGERRSRRKGSSVEFADYRDYVQGDDLRHVDWNIYGRLGALYLKLFEEQEDLTLTIVLDASQSMVFGEPAKLDFCRRLSAALGYVALAGSDRLCIEALAGADVKRLDPCRGRASARKLFSFLSSVEAAGQTELDAALRAHLLRNRRQGVTVLLSDLMDPDGFEGGLRRLRQTGGESYVVHVMAPEEIDPSVAGDLRLIDSESESYAEISVTPALLRRYRANVDGFREAARSFCAKRGIAYLFAPSDASVERLTLEALRAGGMLQ